MSTKEIRRGGCCLRVTPGSAEEPAALGRRQRRARGIAGVLLLGLAAGLAVLALTGWVLIWPITLLAAWFGASHLVAAVTGYYGCPELGAIPSLLARRHVSTSCGPWERLDRWLTR